jgi:CubicO group peptidase (beta-lactamase class C family)
MTCKPISRRSFLAAGTAGTAATVAGCGGGSDLVEGESLAAFGDRLEANSRGRGDLPNWHNLDRLIERAVERQDAPFLVAAVCDRKGVLWHGAVGQATATREASQDVVFHLYSATKAIGSLACMILLDRGKLAMDAPITSVLPEFGTTEPFSGQVLDSLGPTGPVYRPAATPVTLRHLLTHTSGLAYSTWNKKEFDWEAVTSWPFPLESTLKSFSHPLMFDPGTAWTYGVNLDWAGFAAQKVDGRNIAHFVHEEILGPLGMNDTMFEVDAATHRLADIKIRQADGSFGDASFFAPVPRPPVYGMGQALRGTALDYLKFVRLILNDGVVDGRRIVSRQAMALLKQNQIGSLRLPFPIPSNLPDIGAPMDLFPGLNIPCTHTAGFVRNEIDVPGRRRAGSLTWAGFLNTHYWIDPTSGIGAVLFTQSVPFIEPRWQDLYAAFETAVYREVNRGRHGH